MTFRLKGKFAFQMSVMILAAMLLIEFASIVTNQRDLIEALIRKGNALIGGLEALWQHGDEADSFEISFSTFLKNSDVKAGMIIAQDDTDETVVHYRNVQPDLEEEARRLILKAMEDQQNQTAFLGSTWGIFWNQKRYLIMSGWFETENSLKCGAGLIFELDTVYELIRKRHALFLLYILSNTLIITLMGLKQLSKHIFKPMNTLIEKIEKYKDDDGIFFFPEKDPNEFQKLSQSINAMLSREGRHKEELKEAVKSLEKANFELKRAQNDIIRAEKFASTGRLSSGIAHEIGNPIAIVLGYLELLKRETLSDEEKTEFIERSLKEIERIKSILAQLLEFSKKTSENLGKMRINHLLQDILNLLQYHPSFSKIEIIQKFSANSDEITSNEDHLRQVFLNVLMNAADAIGTKPEGASGKIFIETRNTVSDNNGKELVEISISDNGPGISEKDINIIFDPFYTTKEPGEGTGLGLFVSYMIVEKLGGKIQAENNQDEGAKFSIQLPV